MKLGVHDAFMQERADFSGMTSVGNGFHLSLLLQKALIDVSAYVLTARYPFPGSNNDLVHPRPRQFDEY